MNAPPNAHVPPAIEFDPLAKCAYAAYGKTTDFKNFQGNPMPAWDDLPPKIQEAWREASGAVAAVFDRPTEGMTFGDAIEALKGGKRVTRAGWNGKGMWLILARGAMTPGVRTFCIELHDRHPSMGSEAANVRDCIVMLDAEGMFVAWLASQTDMLAEDWAEVA